MTSRKFKINPGDRINNLGDATSSFKKGDFPIWTSDKHGKNQVHANKIYV